jgi:3-phosphoshikimate 1-carboxyvinyltransferase
VSELPRLLGATRVPGDKSIAHRALLLAGLSGSDSTIAGLPEGLDVLATRRCLEKLGVAFEGGARIVRVKPPREWRPGHALDAANSGTTARLLAGALVARRCAATIAGDESLMRRPMERVATPLRALGAAVDTTDGRLPMHVRGATLHPARWEALVPSAQVKSAFLLAALGADGDSAYREAAPTRDHLERMLPSFGVTCGLDEGGWFHLRGCRPRGARVSVPGDPSSAATLLVAAAMLPGSELVIEGVAINPLRLAFTEALARMGAPVEITEQRAGESPEPEGTLRLRAPDELAPLVVEAHEAASVIDELPILLLASAFARGTSRFEGLAELRVKESDRLQAMLDLFASLGVPHEATAEAVSVQGGATLTPCEVDARGDHRLAMVHEALALRLPGQPSPSDPCVAVSWPGFHEKLTMLAR